MSQSTQMGSVARGLRPTEPSCEQYRRTAACTLVRALTPPHEPSPSLPPSSSLCSWLSLSESLLAARRLRAALRQYTNPTAAASTRAAPAAAPAMAPIGKLLPPLSVAPTGVVAGGVDAAGEAGGAAGGGMGRSRPPSKGTTSGGATSRARVWESTGASSLALHTEWEAAMGIRGAQACKGSCSSIAAAA